MKKTVVLGVTGSIAAYKSAEVVSQLQKKGYQVRVILTDAGAQFITPLTLETLSKAPVAQDQFSRETPYEVEHIALAKLADVFLVAPATANFIGKAANGIADDLLLSTFLATRAKVLIAPAMNSNMLEHPAVQKNMETLRQRGCTFIEPDRGLLACGDVGKGRLAPVEEIVKAVETALEEEKDLSGKRILVTAGPTQEPVDPVRYLTNRSSGKMGFAIAEAAARRGAEVTLIAGPVSLDTPEDVQRVDIRTSAELFEQVDAHFDACDALIMAAAPADFTPAEISDQKLKKTGLDGMQLKLSPTRDILKTMGEKKTHQLLMGFAAETRNVEAYALDKLSRKNLDFIAANDVSAPGVGFAGDTNAVTLFYKDGTARDSGLMSKHQVADWLLDALVNAF